MKHFSLHCTSIVTILVSLLVLSVGFNYIFIDKINKLNYIINKINCPVDDNELEKMMAEIKRLSKKTYTADTKYDIKTREPIKNDF